MLAPLCTPALASDLDCANCRGLESLLLCLYLPTVLHHPLNDLMRGFELRGSGQGLSCSCVPSEEACCSNQHEGPNYGHHSGTPDYTVERRYGKLSIERYCSSRDYAQRNIKCIDRDVAGRRASTENDDSAITHAATTSAFTIAY